MAALLPYYHNIFIICGENIHQMKSEVKIKCKIIIIFLSVELALVLYTKVFKLEDI